MGVLFGTPAFAQPSIALTITADPPQVQGVNEVDTIAIRFYNGSTTVSLPVDKVTIQLTSPPGVTFSPTATPELAAKWNYVYTDENNLSLVNSIPVPPHGAPPQLFQTIKVPVTVTAAAAGTSNYYTVELLVTPNPTFQLDGNNSATSTSGQVIVPGTPLPIALSDFTAKLNDKQTVDLNWFTQTEVNNKGFDIERSNNGKDFKKIGYVASKATEGYSAAKLAYTSEDANPVIGDNYYRLKEVSMDGKATYSVVRKVTIGRGQLISLFPNPANSFVNIKGLQEGDIIRVYDIAGKVILEKKAAASQLMQIDVSGIANGNYQVAVFSNDSRVFTGKLVKHD